MASEAKSVIDQSASLVPQGMDSRLIELLATSAWITGLPVFKGERDEDIQEYIRAFEDQTVGLDDRMKIVGIRRSFFGSAREWLNENCHQELLGSDFGILKAKILERYARETTYLRNRLRLTQMRFDINGKETLASFIDRFVALAKRLDIKTDNEIITGILIALPMEVQSDLEYLENIKSIKVLKDLMKLAHRYDSIVSKRYRGPDEFNKLGALVSSISQEELGKAIKSIREEFQRQYEETLAAIRPRTQGVDHRKPSEDRRCYNCQQKGHIARSCPNPKVNKANDQNRPEVRSQKKDYSQVNQEARNDYENKFGKPEIDCPICNGYHFVYHCPLKTLKE